MVHGRAVRDGLSISGTVHDIAGGVVPGATIVVRNGERDQAAVSGPDGRFTVTRARIRGESCSSSARAGFAELARRSPRERRATNLDFVVVARDACTEAVTVTATRSERRTGDVPASVSVLDREDIKQSPAVVADDVLRQIPTFSLFRRTSSLASHPTAQGVSLRGIGPSGVSRTLVLLDGVPVQRSVRRLGVLVARAARERRAHRGGRRIELEPLRQLRDGRRHQHRHQPAARDGRSRCKAQYGSRNSRRWTSSAATCGASSASRSTAASFDTDGYPIVRASERGRVDNNAAVEFWNLNVKLDYAPTDRVHAFVRVGYFDENRDNGKASTIDGTEEANDTTWTSRQRRRAGRGCRTRAICRRRVFTDFETFHSNFLAVPAVDAAAQHRPDDAEPDACRRRRRRHGAVVARVRHEAVLHRRHDWRWVDGDSEENGLDAVTGTQVDAEARLRRHAAQRRRCSCRT